MASIILSRSRVDVDVDMPAIAVVAPGREGPSGIPVVKLEELLATPAKWLDGGEPLTMVVVGLSRMMTPANRVKLGRVILRPRAGLRRVSIDDVLFLSEPWRMWWHFRAVGADEPWGLTDSFLAETRWKAAIELRTENPFSTERVCAAARGVIEARDPFRFAPIDVQVRPASATDHLQYAALKEECFTHERTVSAIIKRLAKFAQESVPERAIPTPARLFSSPPRRIVRTDLAVDTWLVGELLERVALTNAIAEACS